MHTLYIPISNDIKTKCWKDSKWISEGTVTLMYCQAMWLYYFMERGQIGVLKIDYKKLYAYQIKENRC